MSDWKPIETAPKDGTWILGCNNRGNIAVIIWSEKALRRIGYDPKPPEEHFSLLPGWIFPFSTGEVSPFWEESRVKWWMPLPSPPSP